MLSNAEYESGVGLSDYCSPASDEDDLRYPSPSLLEPEQRGSIKRTQAEWNRSLYFVGTDFETLQWDRPEKERILHMTGYGSEWPSWQPAPSVSNLRNPIHQLFSRDQFVVDTRDDFLQDRLWDGLMPALRLASRMLTSPPVLAFLYRIHYGCEVNLSHDGTPLQKLVLNRGYRPRLMKPILEELLKLSTKLKYAFGAFKIKPWNPSQIYAIHSLSTEFVHKSAFVRCRPSDIPKRPRHPNQHHYIIVNEAYGHYFKYSNKRTTDRDQKVQ
jgi:hypothetical protein